MTTMSKFILGKKLGCTQLVKGTGEMVPVTLIGVDDNAVTQIKTAEKDGYSAIQLATGAKKTKNLTKPLRGHFKNLGSFGFVREFKASDTADYQIGSKVNLDGFEEGRKVTVSALTKGRGFQGVVKRHSFSGGPASHGHRDVLRRPGSIGGRFPQRVLKGKKMAGRMGAGRVTTKNLEIVRVDTAAGVLAVKGAVPGHRGAWVEVVSNV